MHLVGFIVKIFHDARSRERQTWFILKMKNASEYSDSVVSNVKEKGDHLSQWSDVKVP